MGAAFTENEKIIIRQQLKEYARECIKKHGMKKTTVDELVEKVGISKGAFYKFYDSKELLFFELMEDFHTEFFELAVKILRERSDLNDRERLEEAMWQVCLLIMESDFMKGSEDEISYLMRKLPPDVLKEHYHSGDTYVLEIIRQSGIPLSASPQFVCAAVHSLETIISSKDAIGQEHFNELLRIFIQGICERIVEV